MSRRKKFEQKENLDRWLISYADFITLMFGTFVVLYALSQVGSSQFGQLENALKKAFTPNQIQYEEGYKELYHNIEQANLTSTLVLEYMNPNYEQSAFEEIKKGIDSLKSQNKLQNVEAKINETGLLITVFNNRKNFLPGRTTLSHKAENTLDRIGVLIGSKFILHQIIIEGHTDKKSSPSDIYPTNWEFSAARAGTVARYFIDKFKFMPDTFTVVGFGNTRPVVPFESPDARAKNSRIEILILRNHCKITSQTPDSFLKLTKSEQQERRKMQLQTIDKINELYETNTLMKQTERAKNVLKKNAYHEEAKRLEKELR